MIDFRCSQSLDRVRSVFCSTPFPQSCPDVVEDMVSICCLYERDMQTGYSCSRPPGACKSQLIVGCVVIKGGDYASE